MPDDVDGAQLVRYMRDEMGVTVAGGQGRLKGKIVRIGHVGYAGAFDVVIGIAALEIALSRFGHTVRFGQGVGAAQAVLADGWAAYGS